MYVHYFYYEWISNIGNCDELCEHNFQLVFKNNYHEDNRTLKSAPKYNTILQTNI